MDLSENDSNAANGHIGSGQCITFLVHITPTLDAPEEIIASLFDVLCHLLKTAPSTSVGVYLVNSTPATLVPLQPLCVETFRALDACLGKADFPLLAADDASFGPQLLAALETAHTALVDAKGALSRVFLITDATRPFNGNRTVLSHLQNRARALAQDKISLFPIVLDNILGGDLNEYNEWLDRNLDLRPPQGTLDAQHLTQRIVRAVEPKRFAFDAALQMGKLMISVRGLNILSQTEIKPFRYYFDPTEGYNYPLHSEATYYDKSETEDPIPFANLVKVALVSKNQHLPIHNLFDTFKRFEPQLKVCGTLPLSKFSPYIHSVAKFVVPNIKGPYTNSDLHFAALTKSLTAKKAMLLCWGSLTPVSVPALYYLIPTPIFTDKLPPLLALVRIPHGDEIRQPPSYLDHAEQVPSKPDTFKPITEIMHLEDMELVPNALLNWKLDTLVKFATNIPPTKIYPGDSMDTMIAAQRELLNGRREVLDILSAYNSLQNTQLLESNAKKPKREPLSDGSVRVLLKSGTLATYSVPELKEFVRSKGIKVPTKKAELLEAIRNLCT